MNHFIIISGELKWIAEMPEKPVIFKNYPEGNVWDRYESALQLAKEKAITVKNPEVLPFKWVTTDSTTWFYNYEAIKENTIYTLDDSYKVDIDLEIMESNGTWVKCHDLMYDRFPEDRKRKLAIVSKAEIKYEATEI